MVARIGKKRKIICFAREPGGAEAIAITLKNKPPESYFLIGKDYACTIFNSWGLPYENYGGNSEGEFFSLMDTVQKKNYADAVLTSAASLPREDMTERYAWKWSSLNKVPCIAILDQWQNYKQRFSGPYKNGIYHYLPAAICAMDESAMQGMIQDGLPAERIKVTGHPSLSRLRQQMAYPNLKEIENTRKSLNLDSRTKLILFVSDPFSHSLGDEVGFTEITILKELLLYLQKRQTKADKIHLVIKLHPKNKIDDFNQLKDEFADLWALINPLFIIDEIAKMPLLMASDFVIGMASIMLMEAIVLGRPTVSLQIGAKEKGWCEAVNQGIIPCITTPEEMEHLLDSLLDNQQYKERYMTAIQSYPIISDAENRIWDVIQTMRIEAGKS